MSRRRDVNAGHVNPSRYNWIRSWWIWPRTSATRNTKAWIIEEWWLLGMVGSMDYPFLCASPPNSLAFNLIKGWYSFWKNGMPIFFMIFKIRRFSAMMTFPITLYIFYFKEFNYNDIQSVSPPTLFLLIRNIDKWLCIKWNIDIDIILYNILLILPTIFLEYPFLTFQRQMHDISLTNNKLSIYRIGNELLSLLLRIKAGLKIGTDGESSWIIFQQTIARFPEEGEGATRLGIISTGLRKHRSKLPPRAIIGNRRKGEGHRRRYGG